MRSNNVKITKDLLLPIREGVHYRLLCLTGKSKGVSYFLEGKRAIMGRGKDAEIQVLDPKSSREHIELKKIDKEYILTDLGSQNGVVVNDLKVVQHNLKDGDKIIIGQTVYKYSVIVNQAKEEPLIPLKKGNHKDPFFLDEGVVDKKKEKKKSKLLYIIIGIFLIWLILSEEEKPALKNVNMKNKESRDITKTIDLMYRKQKKIEDKDTKEKVETFIHRARREYREGNYFRAIEELNLCLILVPSHGYCSFLLRKSKKKFDSTIRRYFEKAKKDIDGLKYQSALVEYCAIIKLLDGYQKAGKKDLRLEDAKKNIGYVEKKIGMELGEHKCF